MDQMDELLTNRKSQLEKVTKMMQDVNQIVTSIGGEVKLQNDKLKKIDTDMDDAAKNVNLGNDELVITKTRQAGANKYLVGIFICALVFLILLIVLLIWRWRR
jgi:t-SNARE complex subunit (syntaxin)